MFPKMAKRTPGPKGHCQPLASGNHQKPPDQVQRALPSIQGMDSPSPTYSAPRILVWYIYGMMYHDAPFFLRNPMVMFSGPNYAFSTQVPKSITHFEGSLSILGRYQKTIQGPQPPGPAGVRLYFLSRIIPRVIP
ncbi:hypothetical protein O181_120030 [Austropuccinia psidii MF-1]|uniref:Uncharacterized protein n=1 Tax=Austropuccinia psidii MF-1 TaxID=1389203 RepID=A0A9Q3KJE8_9BASI|nr:hypothetical protein [Austropuccinia psidii MF-1]